MDIKAQRAIAALNAIAAEELGTPRRRHAPRQEAYPATASCGHSVTVFPKFLIRQASKGPCPRCRAAMQREVQSILGS